MTLARTPVTAPNTPTTALTHPRPPSALTPADALESYLSSVQPSSHRPIKESLRYVARLLEVPDDVDLGNVAWHKVTFRDFLEIKRRLQLAEMRGASPNAIDPTGKPILDPIASSTANRHLGALRKILRQCFLLSVGAPDNIPAEEWARIKEVPSFKVSSEQLGREVTSKDITALLDACNPSTMRGARDAAILALLFACGLRRFEAAGARQTKYKDGVLTISGKGSKVRTVFLDGEPRAAVDHWLRMRGAVDIDRILVRLTPRGNLTKVHKQIGGAALLHAARRLARLAGVRGFGCHDLRRTFATQLIRKKVPMPLVQEAMGHSSANTTGRYNMMAQEERRAAMGELEGFRRSKT